MHPGRIGHSPGADRQAGVYSSAFAVTIVLLLFFVGLGLDAGRLYVAKTELQNAADACALAAASALTGGSSNQLLVGELAGMTAGSRNRVLFQTEAVEVPASAVTFSATLHGDYQPRSAIGSAGAANMKYARCTLAETGITPWMVNVANALPGVDIGDSVVAATAVATLDPSITACAMPLGVCRRAPGPDFGLTVGEWLQGRLQAGESMTGAYKWVQFPGFERTPDLDSLLRGSGQCDLTDSETVTSHNGVLNSLVEAWNGRFGVYKGSGSPATMPPDYSGYSYSPHVYPDGAANPDGNWDGSAGNAFPDFVERRGANTPWNEVPGLGGGWRAIDSAQHAAGADRRLMVGPIVDCDQLGTGGPTLVEGWACMMMLSPVANPTHDWMMLEYRGLAGAPGSGCATSGLPGGGPGAPKVPGLVL